MKIWIADGDAEPSAVVALLREHGYEAAYEGEGEPEILRLGNTALNRGDHALSTPFGSVRLTNREYGIMELLLSNPRRLISTERILERVWGYEDSAGVSVVWVYISYLRKKLTALRSDVRINVSRNAGYRAEVATGDPCRFP